MQSKFNIGDKVRVREDYPLPHPRHKLVKGWEGVIVAYHGQIKNPTERPGLSPPMYSVIFERPENVKIWFDVYEDWIEPKK